MVFELICVVCGKEFTYKKLTNFIKKTCSKKCRYESLKRTWIEKVPRIYKICMRCGREFWIYPAWARKRDISGKYCSIKCRFPKNPKFTKEEKIKARNEIRKALKLGVIKQLSCRDCESMKTEAHHYKGYAPENLLEVVWLCGRHHNIEHERLRAEGKEVS